MPPKASLTKHKLHKFKAYTLYHYNGASIYWVLLFLVFATLISLPLIKVDVTVQSRGLIKTINQVSPIASPITGRVVRIELNENKKVRKGDTLVVFDQSGISNEINITQQQLELNSSYLTDLDEIIKPQRKKELISPLYQKNYIDYQGGLRKIAQKIDQYRIDFKRTSSLYKDGVVPLSTFQKDSFKLREAEVERASFTTAALAGWEADKKNYTMVIHELNVRLENLKQKQRQHFISAPFDGNIINFIGVASGAFISENDVIAKLSPEEGLIAECYVSPTDIGFIRDSMQARFQVDAYNYNQWGLLQGKVMDVASDVTVRNERYVYVIKSNLERDYLELKNGIHGPIKKGMSLTGRFIVTQRSLFQLVFDDINDWLNPKIIQAKEKI